MIRVENNKDFNNNNRMLIHLPNGNILSIDNNNNFKYGIDKEKLSDLSEDRGIRLAEDSGLTLDAISFLKEELIGRKKDEKITYEIDGDSVRKIYKAPFLDFMSSGLEDIILDKNGLIVLSYVDGNKKHLSREESKEIFKEDGLLGSMGCSHKGETIGLLALTHYLGGKNTIGVKFTLEGEAPSFAGIEAAIEEVGERAKRISLSPSQPQNLKKSGGYRLK